MPGQGSTAMSFPIAVAMAGASVSYARFMTTAMVRQSFPFDPERHTVLLVRQFRLPAYLFDGDGHIIEACAGLLDGNDPADCARREAEEELGFAVRNLRRMASVYSTPGAVTERLTLFLADYSPADRQGDGGGHAHEGEDIEVLELPLDDARRLARDGGIVDAKTVLLLMYLERERGLPPL